MYNTIISTALQIKLQQVEAVLNLLAEGSTIPFIARYRKDVTGNLDEVQIQQIQDEAKRLKDFEERKETIVNSITEQGKMTDALMEKINVATTLSQLEDIYLPYKPKRKTKAQTAKENGLEPLATTLLQQTNIALATEAAKYLTDNIKTIDEALQGARDIIAEMVNEEATARAKMRKLFEEEGVVKSSVVNGKEEEGVKYKDYFDSNQLIKNIPSHRTLAILRGFLEGFLKMSIETDEEKALTLLEDLFITTSLNESVTHIKKAIRDSYKRLLQPAMETEFRTLLKTKADEEAITVFSENLRQLLLSAPLGSKRIMAIDPGYRTGCKVVCIDEQGNLLCNDLIFVHENNKKQHCEYLIKELVAKHHIQAFAIGDGTAGRETEQFVKQLQLNLPIFMVNEDGASIYSASEIAREEFGEYDVTVRGAVSIGRRLMDPLAELVKIDPKSIGVGQYQHDVNQVRLKEKLDQTVVSCVNQVGVNLNTASKQLLSYVSGIGISIADNIVKYRNEIGKFQNRQQLLKVPRLGAKAFEQCAGFLRIKESNHPLDKSAVHPEAYSIVEKMAKDAAIELSEIIGNEKLLNSIDAKKYITENFGTITIADIIKELKKPGLDPRAELETFEFASIYKIEDVIVGNIVPGLVTNLTRFGAFVDIGVKQDGLVHVSEIAHKYITDPNEVLKLNQKVQVKVLEVDVARKRIMLSIKQTQEFKKESNNKPNNKPSYRLIKPEPQKELSMTDALSVLKGKFGK
jgi:protein Tex